MFASVKRFARKLVKDESGATAIEYALIVALISVVAVGAYSTVGTKITDVFNNVGSKLTPPAQGPGGAG